MLVRNTHILLEKWRQVADSSIWERGCTAPNMENILRSVSSRKSVPDEFPDDIKDCRAEAIMLSGVSCGASKKRSKRKPANKVAKHGKLHA